MSITDPFVSGILGTSCLLDKHHIMGREVIVEATNRKLNFGSWEMTFYDEVDGRRQKCVLIKIIGA